MSRITTETRLAQSEAVLFTEVDGGITLMNMDNAEYYHFDEVGAAIWSRIDGQSNVGDICAALLSQFEADASDCEDDTFEFLAKVLDLGLIEVAP